MHCTMFTSHTKRDGSKWGLFFRELLKVKTFSFEGHYKPVRPADVYVIREEQMERSVYVVIGWTPGSGDATYCNVFIIFIPLTFVIHKDFSALSSLFALPLLKTFLLFESVAGLL